MRQPGDQEAQRDIFNIDNKGSVTVVNHPAPQRSHSQALLLQEVRKEVISRLAQSLHNAVFLNLGMQSQPQQVKRPWDAEIKIGSKSPEALPAETVILEVFDRAGIDGRLLILGEPGAGKTTTMLDLAKALCDRAEQKPTAFIPVLLNLSSWQDPKQTMAAWLVEELKSKYGVRKDIGTKWLAEKQLLPLLDGLDEVKPEHQEGCVQAINRWLESEDRSPSLAVCCRREEYEKVVRGQWQADIEEVQDETRMHLNGAILLQTLTDEQIETYLTAANQPELWQTMQSDETLLELIRTPLFLSIVGLSVTEQKFSFADWRSLTSREARLQYLFDVFWEAAISRVLVEPKLIAQGIQSKSYGKTKPPSAKQTRHWLIFLAQHLQRGSQTEFLIEQIQPSCLQVETEKQIYLMGVWQSFSLIIGSVSGLCAGRNSGELLGALFVTLLIGLLVDMVGWILLGQFYEIDGKLSFSIKIGVTSELINRIEPAEIIIFSWNKFVVGALFGCYSILPAMVLNFSFIGILSFYLEHLHIAPSSVSSKEIFFFLSYFFITVFLLFVIGIGVFFGSFRWDLDAKKYSNQGIWKSAQNAVFVAISSGLFFGLIFTLPIYFRGTSFGTLGLLIGALAGLWFGGTACIKHCVLRHVLWRRKHIPWNYARFLDYCTERLFLQRVGGRYRFIHKSLQEHFARMGE